MDDYIREQLSGIHLSRIQHYFIFGRRKMNENEILIDEIDMDIVQMLITAVNESKLNDAEREKLRKHLDKWQRALTLTGKIRVTF